MIKKDIITLRPIVLNVGTRSTLLFKSNCGLKGASDRHNWLPCAIQDCGTPAPDVPFCVADLSTLLLASNNYMEKEYVGRNGKIVLYDDHLVIKRGARGFLLGGGMLRGDKTIPFGSIVAVQFKKSGMTLGYIQFTLMGGNEAKGGVMQSVTDENTVNFQSWGGDINKEFMELKNIVEEKIKQAKSTNSNSSSLDELEKLATLKEKGIVTEEEFQQKKKHLLSK